MVVDKKCIRQLRKNHLYTGIKFTEELEKILLDRLGGTDPDDPFGFSEQDLHEQSRRIIMQYQRPEGRLSLLYSLDKIENEIRCLSNKLDYLRQKISYLTHGDADPEHPFEFEPEFDEDVPM